MLKFFPTMATDTVIRTAMTYGLTGLTGYFAGKGISARAGNLENHPFINWIASMALLSGGARTLRLNPLSSTFLIAVAAGNARGNYLQHRQMDFDRQVIRAEAHSHAPR